MLIHVFGFTSASHNRHDLLSSQDEKIIILKKKTNYGTDMQT